MYRYFALAVVFALLTGCGKEIDLGQNSSINGPSGRYDTKVEFNVLIDNVDLDVDISPITRVASGGSGISKLWYVIFDSNGLVLPTSDGKTLREVDLSSSQTVNEYLPQGIYRALFLAAGAKNATVAGNDIVKAITAPTDQWLSAGNQTGLPVNGLYLYHDKPIEVQLGVANSFEVPLSPIVGEFSLNLTMANPEQEESITKIEVEFDNPTYGAFCGNNTYAGVAAAPLKADLTARRSFFSLPIASGEGSGRVLITMRDPDNNSHTRSYAFKGLGIDHGKKTTLNLSLDLAYSTLGLLSLDSDLSQATNKSLMLQDGELEETYDNNFERRSFIVSSPLKFTIRNADANHSTKYLEMQFYSPIGLTDVDIYMEIVGMGESFKVYHFAEIKPFQEASLPLKILTQTASYQTMSGKIITLPANGDLLNNNVKFIIKTPDSYYNDKLAKIKPNCLISFCSNLPIHNDMITRMTPVFAREAVAMALNMSYMFGTEIFEKELYKLQGTISGCKTQFGDNVYLDLKEHYRQIMNLRSLGFAVDKDADGIYGKQYDYRISLDASNFFNHYADHSATTFVLFHEYAHVFGYKDKEGGDPSIKGDLFQTDGPWITLCGKYYKEMSLSNQLPVSSYKVLDSKP